MRKIKTATKYFSKTETVLWCASMALILMSFCAFDRENHLTLFPDMRLHDLRHTAITYMLEAGANPRTVSAFAGHATPSFTMTQYAHVLDQSKKNASDARMKTLFSN